VILGLVASGSGFPIVPRELMGAVPSQIRLVAATEELLNGELVLALDRKCPNRLAREVFAGVRRAREGQASAAVV
jgi:hypothetical protein